ncbi:dienelactone hydrolase [Jannaschia sp. EhC01]|nr:dienelactone hydrolase [Jannaschia sp. EhC01]
MFTELKAADGHVLECWTQPAQGQRKGGIVILQEIFGVTDQLKGVATRYAALGYEVAIPALFDRQERGAVVPFDQAIKGRDMMLASDLSQTMMDADAAVQALGGKVVVIGFCWGGGLAIRAAQVLDIVGAVSFYGTRLPQYMDQPLRAPVLGHFGTQDDHTPPELIAEARTAWPQMEVHMYPAGHAFANDARPSYVADATATAHARTEAFLAQHLC